MESATIPFPSQRSPTGAPHPLTESASHGPAHPMDAAMRAYAAAILLCDYLSRHQDRQVSHEQLAIAAAASRSLVELTSQTVDRILAEA